MPGFLSGSARREVEITERFRHVTSEFSTHPTLGLGKRPLPHALTLILCMSHIPEVVPCACVPVYFQPTQISTWRCTLWVNIFTPSQFKYVLFPYRFNDVRPVIRNFFERTSSSISICVCMVEFRRSVNLAPGLRFRWSRYPPACFTSLSNIPRIRSSSYQILASSSLSIGPAHQTTLNQR